MPSGGGYKVKIAEFQSLESSPAQKLLSTLHVFPSFQSSRRRGKTGKLREHTEEKAVHLARKSAGGKKKSEDGRRLKTLRIWAPNSGLRQNLIFLAID